MAPGVPVPKYHQIYLVLREQLHEGRFADGLPGEISLVQQFGVARVTVRRALEMLATEGLISREPGRGTRALARLPGAQRKTSAVPKRAKLTGLLENLVSMGLQTTVKVLEVSVISAPQAVCQALTLPEGAQVQKAIRVRSTREGPLSHITTYVPQSIGRQFGAAEMRRKPLLVLLEESGVKVGRAHQTISARLADAVVARHLDISVGTALLAVQRLIYDDQDRPIQFLNGLYRPDRYEYEMQLSRVGDIDAKVWVSQDLTAHFH